MRKNQENFLGFKGENFEVMSGPIKHNGYVSCWVCKCVCGKEFIAKSNHIKRQPNKSCGCRRYKVKNHGNRKHKDPKTISYKTLQSSYKYAAKNRGYCWELTLETFISLINQKCFYCDSEPSKKFNVYLSKDGKLTEQTKNSEFYLETGIITNGLDRKDNCIGYTIDNVVPCCTTCNFAKNNLTISEFMCWIKKIVIKYKDIGELL